MVRRVRVTGEAAVPDWVDNKNREFVHPFPQIPPDQPAEAGGAGGEVTVMIAAADSTDLSKSKADFVCTGVGDHTTIQTAIDLLPFDGGLIRLAEGEYHPDWDQIKLPNSGQVTIQGSGMGTIIDMNDTNPSTGTGPVFEIVAGADLCQILDMQIWGPSNGTSSQVAIECNGDDNNRFANLLISTFLGGGIVLNGSDYTLIENCGIEDCATSSIALDSTTFTDIASVHIAGQFTTSDAVVLTNADSTRITDCTILFGAAQAGVVGTGVNVSVIGCYISGSGFAIENQGDQDWLVIGNTFVQTDGVFCDVGANNTQIIGNRFDTGGQVLFDGGAFTGCQVSDNLWDVAATPSIDGVIRFDNGATDCVIAGNIIPDANGLNGIVIVSGTDCLIADNFVALADLGILVSTGTRVTVRGNKVKWPGEHGIQYDGDFGTVSDNDVFGASQNTTNTWDNLNISGDGNLIQNNHSEPATVSPLTRYGLNIAAGNDNAAHANQLGDSSVYGTADSIDSGTNTQTSPAAGAIGGQFAY